MARDFTEMLAEFLGLYLYTIEKNGAPSEHEGEKYRIRM